MKQTRSKVSSYAPSHVTTERTIQRSSHKNELDSPKFDYSIVKQNAIMFGSSQEDSRNNHVVVKGSLKSSGSVQQLT